jgi:hypothetical protein
MLSITRLGVCATAQGLAKLLAVTSRVAQTRGHGRKRRGVVGLNVSQAGRLNLAEREKLCGLGKVGILGR